MNRLLAQKQISRYFSKVDLTEFVINNTNNYAKRIKTKDIFSDIQFIENNDKADAFGVLFVEFILPESKAKDEVSKILRECGFDHWTLDIITLAFDAKKHHSVKSPIHECISNNPSVDVRVSAIDEYDNSYHFNLKVVDNFDIEPIKDSLGVIAKESENIVELI